MPDTALRHNDANVHIAFSAFSSILLIENAPKNKPETCEAAQQLSGADTKGSVISACMHGRHPRFFAFRLEPDGVQ